MTFCVSWRLGFRRPTNKALDAYELIAKVAGSSQRDDRAIAPGVCDSYARGEARPDSDIDSCVLTANPSSLFVDLRVGLTLLLHFRNDPLQPDV